MRGSPAISAAGPCGGDASVLDHVGMAGDVQRALHVLLGQQQRQALRAQPAHQREDLERHHRRQARASARRAASACGSAIRPRPMASICCSPPDSVDGRPATRARAGAERSSYTRSTLRCHCGRARSVDAAQAQVLVHAQRGKDHAALRHQHQAGEHAAVRGAAADVLAQEAQRAALDRQQAGTASSSASSCRRRWRRAARSRRPRAPRSDRPWTHARRAVAGRPGRRSPASPAAHACAPKYTDSTFALSPISCRRAFGDQLAVVQHDDAAAQFHQRAHHVLDHQQREPARRLQMAQRLRASAPTSVGVSPAITSSSSSSRAPVATQRAISRRFWPDSVKRRRGPLGDSSPGPLPRAPGATRASASATAPELRAGRTSRRCAGSPARSATGRA